MAQTEGRNGRLFALDDGRSMILNRCAIMDKTEFRESLSAQFLVDSGSTEMAHGLDDSPRLVGSCSTVRSTLRMRATEVPWSKRGKIGAVRDSEPVTVTFVVTDVLKVTLSVSSLPWRMQVTFGLQRGSIQRKEGIIE